MRLLRRQCRCCNIWSTLFSVYLAGTIYLAFFQFKTGLLKGVKYETEWKGPSNDYERPLRQNMQKTQTYQPLSISAKLLFMSNAKNVSQDTSWRTTKKTANNSLHFNKNKDPLIKDKPINQRAENFNKKPEVETRNKSVEVEKHGRNQIDGSANKLADAGHEGKLAMEGQGHKRPAVDSETNVKPAVNAEHHEKPSINSKNNKKLAEYYAAHGKPAEDVEHHGKPEEDMEHHRKPAEDGEHHGKPAEDSVAHGKPAEDYVAHEKPAEDVKHHGKLDIEKRKNATNQGKPVGENHGTRKHEANSTVKENPAVDAVHKEKPAVHNQGNEKPAADSAAKRKPAVDVEHHGKPAMESQGNNNQAADRAAKKQPVNNVENADKDFMPKQLNYTNPQFNAQNSKNKTMSNGNPGKIMPAQPAPEGFIGAKGRTILLWTSLTAKRPMWNFKTWTLMRCPYKCQITNDRSYLSQASLVLFRLRMLQTIPDKFLREFVQDYDLNDLPKKKYPQQVWVDVNQESPMYSHSDEELLPVDKYMDYIVSYLSQSDYTYAYKSLYQERKERLPPINYAENKTKTALWYVSHCADLSGRWKYVEELKKYNVSVDVFGKCSGLQDGCKGSKDINCVNTLKAQYKFYLAFENSICSEYITEKYWNILNSSNKMYNIPIALGARLHEYEAVSPENSFLHVRNFTGAKDLAQYIHEIDRDDRKFNSYHSWREKYETYIDKQELLDCWICRMAYEQPKTARPVYSEFWSRKKLCDLTPEPI